MAQSNGGPLKTTAARTTFDTAPCGIAAENGVKPKMTTKTALNRPDRSIQRCLFTLYPFTHTRQVTQRAIRASKASKWGNSAGNLRNRRAITSATHIPPPFTGAPGCARWQSLRLGHTCVGGTNVVLSFLYHSGRRGNKVPQTGEQTPVLPQPSPLHRGGNPILRYVGRLRCTIAAQVTCLTIATPRGRG